MPEAPQRFGAGAAVTPGSPTSPAGPDRLGTDQPRMRMRQVLARLGSPRSQQPSQLEPLFNAMRTHHAKLDTALIERAYRTAEHYHSGQTRKSGDPYITHPRSKTPPTRWSNCVPTSATRSPRWWTASRSSTR